jgi:hypothetical protein
VSSGAGILPGILLLLKKFATPTDTNGTESFIFFIRFSCIMRLFHSNYAERRDKINTIKTKVRAVRAKPSSSSGYSSRGQAGIRRVRVVHDYPWLKVKLLAFLKKILTNYSHALADTEDLSKKRIYLESVYIIDRL